MVLEVLAPGVEDGQQADLGPEVLGIGGELQQGLGGGPEQQAVDHRVGSASASGPRTAGSVKTTWKYGRRQQVSRLRPPSTAPRRWPGTWDSGGCGRSCRRPADARTAVALLDVPAQGRGAAGGHVVQSPPLLG